MVCAFGISVVTYEADVDSAQKGEDEGLNKANKGFQPVEGQLQPYGELLVERCNKSFSTIDVAIETNRKRDIA